VRNSALGFTGATQDLPFYTAGGSELLVFKVGPPGGNAQQRAQSQPPASAPDKDDRNAQPR
jgi:alcohol dehydrogenase (cytochrome c)